MSEASKEYFGIKKQIHELEVSLQTTAMITSQREEEIHQEIASLKESLKEHLPYEFLCTKCGRQATMPFEPRKNKPNYCIECFWEIHG